MIVRGRFENQRRRGRAHGGRRRSRSSPATTATVTSSRVYLGCQMPHIEPRRRRRQLRARARRRATDRAARRRVVRRQALGAGGHRGGARRARARPAGEVDRDPLGEHDRHAARARPGAVRRARAAPRRHHRRPALPRRRRRRRLRRVRRHARVRSDTHRCRRASTASRRSATTSRSRSPTSRRWARTAAPAVPRRRRCSSASSTWPPAELGMDPVELRRRNFLQPDEFPYSTVTGVTYDVGDYDAALTEALRIAGYEELRAEQASAPGARRREAARHRRLPPTSRSPRAARRASSPRSRCTPTAARR